jgi:DNA end-binding protein Ku
MPGAIWSGTISFGLVVVPVRMVSATRDLDIHFHQIDARTGERVQIRRVSETDGEEVSWDEIGHGYELDEQLVVLTDDELEAAAPERTHTIEIEEFVQASEIDPAQFNQPYFLLPSSDAEGVIRAYQLLRDGMAQTDQIAIGRVVLRSNEYLVAVHVRENLLSLSTMLFADEIRDASEIDAIPKGPEWAPKRGELSTATELIEAMTRDFDPDSYEDRYRTRLQQLVDAKAKAKGKGKGAAEAEPDDDAEDAPASQAAPDLMAALRQSLAAAKNS